MIRTLSDDFFSPEIFLLVLLEGVFDWNLLSELKLLSLPFLLLDLEVVCNCWSGVSELDFF